MRINRVYTRAGDSGKTALIGGARVSKADLRIECYGTVDELLAALGLARVALAGGQPGASELLPILTRIQNELFNVGARLATPDPARRAKLPPVEDRHIAALEADIDRLNEGLPDLASFVLPGGGWVSAYCHLARTICRRAERRVCELLASEPTGGVDATDLTYLNRLSDALFVLGRFAAAAAGEAEPLWTPEDT